MFQVSLFVEIDSNWKKNVSTQVASPLNTSFKESWAIYKKTNSYFREKRIKIKTGCWNKILSQKNSRKIHESWIFSSIGIRKTSMRKDYEIVGSMSQIFFSYSTCKKRQIAVAMSSSRKSFCNFTYITLSNCKNDFCLSSNEREKKLPFVRSTGILNVSSLFLYTTRSSPL